MPRTKDPTKPKRNIWTETTTKYGTYEGPAGNPEQWAAAFGYVKMTRDHALEILNQHESPFDVLGLQQSATENEIKKAMRTLALKYRQDRGNDSNREMFDKVMAAYTLLMN